MMSHSPENVPRHHALLLLLAAYPVLALAGAITHRQVFALLALAVLLTLPMLPRLRTRRRLPWLGWLAMLAALLGVWLNGLADLVLEAVPVLISAVLAWGFGHTLVTDEPLVARFIVAIEGVARLRQPGVARYARQVTAFWTILLGTQAVLLAVLWLCADRSGLLVRVGWAAPWPIPERWAAIWLHVGCYAVLGAAFALEYGYRRWRLRHLDHLALPVMLKQMALCWPRLRQGKGAATP